MPEQYSNEMRFALFKNDKDGNEKRPDYRGTMMIAGVEYDLSAWIKTSKNGNKFMAGQVQPRRDRTKPAQQEDKLPTDQAETDDVPF